MMSGLRTVWRFLNSMLDGKGSSYTVMVVPNDGGEMSNHSFNSQQIRTLLNAMALLVAVIAFSVGAMYYVIYTGWADRDALKEYYAAKEMQDKRIEDLQTMTDNVQKQLAELQKLKKDVLREMKKAGMEAPNLSDESDKKSGQGGPIFGFGDTMSTRIVVLEEQNSNLAFNIEVDRQDVKKLYKAIHQDNYKKEVTPDIWPVDNGWISSDFGRRQNPVTGEWGDFHPGLDIAAPYGEPVYAGASGRVTHAGWYSGYGKYIEIEHDFGYSTAYGHLSTIAVNVNAYVVKGQFIGRVGSTGFSTGPHLHYEVILWGEQINPRRMIK
ncbi:MAG: peptidoglycan DD-metalloendopeptidase family protein [Acidaminococcaceae bacterium]|nr:peptidoglycan DD-metalloendopeptidase family protein [Acidaminococcaceae bacterium]